MQNQRGKSVHGGRHATAEARPRASAGTVRATTAPSPAEATWTSIDWGRASDEVQRLEQRIFRATQQGQWRQVRSLQKLLLRSDSNLLLSVRHVTQVNAGKRTPGVDGRVALNADARGRLVRDLRQRQGHRVRPVRRVYIPKASGKLRPLGIPTIEDRVRQHVVKTALEPSWEARFEANSYGFRPGRSQQDAMASLYTRLHGRTTMRWVLDADIRGAFDHISHAFILRRLGNFPARRQIERWLTAGYLEHGSFFATTGGTPQGGIVSPLLANIALDGLGDLLGRYRSPKDKRHGQFGFTRYADDFVVTAPSRDRLEQVVPEIQQWLAERGLELNDEKTRIEPIEAGFDYLGFTFRHFDGKLLIKPQKSKVLGKLREIKGWLRQHPQIPTDRAIAHLNPIIRGWAQYYRHVVSAKVFGYFDHRMYQMLWSWAKRRHPKKPARWIKARYFRTIDRQKWVFTSDTMNRRGQNVTVRLVDARRPIRRHVLVKGTASPMDPSLARYWGERRKRLVEARYAEANRLRNLYALQRGRCRVCRQPLLNGEALDTHHLQRVTDGGSNARPNLEVRHEACHYNAHGNNRRHL